MTTVNKKIQIWENLPTKLKINLEKKKKKVDN